MNDKLLSICIPTYNRADKLQISLLAILKQVNKYQDKIEVIVSDNASTDTTKVVLTELKKEYSFLKILRNSINLGPNLNFFKLSDEYATGKYFWLIGDDDVIDSNGIDIIIKILIENQNIPFLGLNFRVLAVKDIVGFGCTKIGQDIKRIKMSQLLSEQCRAENLMATFISCNIILLDRFKNYDKSIFSTNSWDDYRSLFPHTHVITSVIKSDEDVIYIKEPLLSVMVHEKEWDDRLALINLYFILDVYEYYRKSGYRKRDIWKVKQAIIDSGLGALITAKVQYKYKWGFLKFSLFDFYFYKLIVAKIVDKITKKLKS
ncbi:glycosyltransferase family 2 protein [Pedobacter borealis]|uniref:glycosyltransferase family 2 protein n=1 Tax=Pedobacter borealis TaxID=475254 RepID=UPI00068A998E|nr:glycosyltransferase family 2 protein [Pedobacter borealis]